MTTSLLTQNDLHALFDALDPQGHTPLNVALRETAALARQRHMSLEELLSNLTSCGIKNNPALESWLEKQF